MQNATAMNADIKALLTLLLLKTGTTPKEIHTVLMVASTSRVMIAEEYAASHPEHASNVPMWTATRSNVPASLAEFDPEADGIYSDIKALLSLVLLQNGVSANEIQTTLRVAATSRRAIAERREDFQDQDDILQNDDIPQKPASRTPERRQATARQSLRNDALSPISIRDLQRNDPMRRTA